MKLAIVTNEVLKEEFLSKKIPVHVSVCFVSEPENIPPDAVIIFDLLFEHNEERISILKKFLPRPIFINAVTCTLALVSQPFIRINAWPTFLKRNITEVVVLPDQKEAMQKAFKQLEWDYQLVPDVPGMISARITAMIINEAYITFSDNVSTKEEIDIAMKLGTHYPYGPFEWSRLIGLRKIYELLIVLSKENNLYEVSRLLTNDINT